MSYDIMLLSVLKNKKTFLRFTPYIKEHSVSKEVWTLIKAIKEYYRVYASKDEYTLEELKMYFFMLHSKAKEDTLVLYTKMFDAIEKASATTIDSAVLDDVFAHFIKMDYATQAMNAAHKIITSNTGNMDDLESLVHDYRSEVGHVISKKDLFCSTKLSEVVKVAASPGYNWRLQELNVALGPIRDGNFIILAARPETGKTTMACSEMTHIAPQITNGRPIIWVNNEEPSYAVMMRLIQAYFGIDKHTMMANLKYYEDIYTAAMGDKILVTGDDSDLNSVDKLDALFADTNPAMVVFDQLDKVEGYGKSERDDLRIGKLYLWARKLAKKYGPVVAVSQVDGTGEGQEWIYMNQLRGSKTDKVGEADAIVTIGRSNDPTKEYNRYMHVPKNKLVGGKDSKEEYRHGYFEILIDPTTSRYKGVM